VTYLAFPQLERVGRLGNQLWQIASTLGLARRHGLEPRFPSSWSYRPYFSIPDEYFEPVEESTPQATSLGDLAHLDWRTRVYLQDLTFIEDVEEEIDRWFQPSERASEIMAERIGLLTDDPTLVIHVRRGDNLVQEPCYPIPSIEYYLDAVRRHPDHDVVIFGDDYEWNRRVLSPLIQDTDWRVQVWTIEGVPRPKEHEPNYMTAPILDWIDLFAMASFDTAFCLSNSTMGWWAAWLSGSSDVCYPDPWYGPELDINQAGYIDGSLMMPKAWEERAA
jgi:hypothetical protein